jgi:hypothetical protein
MIREAEAAKLVFRPDRVRLILGLAGGPWQPPNPAAMIHNSLTSGWLLLEPLPHLYWEMSCDPPRRGVRFPLGRLRTIPVGATIHETVLARMKLGLKYKPSNLPAQYEVEPWVRWNG